MIETMATIAGVLLVVSPILGFITIYRLIAARERQVLAHYESIEKEE